MAPVALGDKVGILLSFEEQTRSSVRLCFRSIRSDGQPVACGYQTMICMHKDTYELVPAPPVLAQYADARTEYSLLETLINPSFAERARNGSRGVKEIFTEKMCALGKSVANSPLERAYPKIIDENGKEFAIGS